MSEFLQLTLTLAILLTSAKLAGAASVRLGQPSVLGELLAGLILGPTFLNLIHLPAFTSAQLSQTIDLFAQMGVMLLMFIAGLELHVRDLVRSANTSAPAGLLGVSVSIFGGWLVGRLSGLQGMPAIYLGLAIAATSVSIAAQTMMEMDVLRTKVGLAVLGAAVFDDIFVIVLLSAFLAVERGSGGSQAIWSVLVRMLAFLIIAGGVGFFLLPHITRRVSRLPISQGALTLAIVGLLMYGLAAELIGGMAALLGAFMAGLVFGRTPEKQQIDAGVRSLAYSFFVPIFFVNIGLQLNLRGLSLGSVWLLGGISIAAILAKVAGAGGGARLAGWSWRQAAQLGVAMLARGEVSLIVGSVGVQQGMINAEVLPAVVGMVILTTLATPPLIKLLFSRPALAVQPGSNSE